jgi:hypothetical protein
MNPVVLAAIIAACSATAGGLLVFWQNRRTSQGTVTTSQAESLWQFATDELARLTGLVREQAARIDAQDERLRDYAEKLAECGRETASLRRELEVFGRKAVTPLDRESGTAAQ